MKNFKRHYINLVILVLIVQAVSCIYEIRYDYYWIDNTWNVYCTTFGSKNDTVYQSVLTYEGNKRIYRHNVSATDINLAQTYTPNSTTIVYDGILQINSTYFLLYSTQSPSLIQLWYRNGTIINTHSYAQGIGSVTYSKTRNLLFISKSTGVVMTMNFTKFFGGVDVNYGIWNSTFLSQPYVLFDPQQQLIAIRADGSYTIQTHNVDMAILIDFFSVSQLQTPYTWSQTGSSLYIFDDFFFQMNYSSDTSTVYLIYPSGFTKLYGMHHISALNQLVIAYQNSMSPRTLTISSYSLTTQQLTNTLNIVYSGTITKILFSEQKVGNDFRFIVSTDIGFNYYGSLLVTDFSYFPNVPNAPSNTSNVTNDTNMIDNMTYFDNFTDNSTSAFNNATYNLTSNISDSNNITFNTTSNLTDTSNSTTQNLTNQTSSTTIDPILNSTINSTFQNITIQQNLTVNNQPTNSLQQSSQLEKAYLYILDQLNGPLFGTMNKIPGSRKYMKPFFYYFVNMDCLWLYNYHQRNYDHVIQKTFQTINVLQDEKWRLLQVQQFSSSLSLRTTLSQYKLPFTQMKYHQIQNHSQGFMTNTLDFFSTNFILLLLTFILGRGLGALLLYFKSPFYTLFEPFSYVLYFAIVAIQGNVQLFSYFIEFQIKTLSSGNAWNRFINLSIVAFAFLILCLAFIIPFLAKYLYRKEAFKLFDNYKQTLSSLFYLFFNSGVRNFLLGTTHSIFNSFYSLKISLLCIIQTIFFSYNIFSVSSKKYSYFQIKSLCWINIIATFTRIMMILTFLIQQDIQTSFQLYIQHEDEIRSKYFTEYYVALLFVNMMLWFSSMILQTFLFIKELVNLSIYCKNTQIHQDSKDCMIQQVQQSKKTSSSIKHIQITDNKAIKMKKTIFIHNKRLNKKLLNIVDTNNKLQTVSQVQQSGQQKNELRQKNRQLFQTELS